VQIAHLDNTTSGDWSVTRGHASLAVAIGRAEEIAAASELRTETKMRDMLAALA
jgi:hypothetical protein